MSAGSSDCGIYQRKGIYNSDSLREQGELRKMQDQGGRGGIADKPDGSCVAIGRGIIAGNPSRLPDIS